MNKQFVNLFCRLTLLRRSGSSQNGFRLYEGPLNVIRLMLTILVYTIGVLLFIMS